MVKLIFILLSFLSLLNANIHITVSLPVQKYFLDKIAKDEFIVHVVKQKNFPFDKLKKDELENLAYSRAYLTLGLKEEQKYIKKLTSINKRLKVIDITKNIQKDIVNGEENPYIWLDPLKVRELVFNLVQELTKLKSYRSMVFEENSKILLNEVDEVFLYLKSRLDASETFNIYVYESLWHYYAKRFRLNLYYKENRFTTIDEISSLIKESRKYEIRKLLVREGTSYKQARSLVSHINATIAEHDIEKYDWRSNMYLLTREITKK